MQIKQADNPARAGPMWAAITVLGSILILFLAHFFESFPNGWDQAEYVWCIKDHYLPHSPYIAFYLMGSLLSLFLPPAGALSLLSSLSGVAILILLYRIVIQWADHRPLARFQAAVAVVITAFLYLFVRQATTQEVYAFQTALVLAAIYFGLGTRRFSLPLSGVFFGLAIAAHSSSAFFSPALFYLWVIRSSPGRLRDFLRAVIPLCAIVLGAAMLIFIILPPIPGESRMKTTCDYLAGISSFTPPVLETIRAGEPSHPHEPALKLFVKSASGMLNRLTSLEIVHTRPPVATAPLGWTRLHIMLALTGWLVAWFLNRRAALFWALYALPYLAYELIKGNPDYGVYLPFLAPPMAFTLSFLAATMRARMQSPFLIAIALGGLVFFMVFPSLLLLTGCWNDPSQERKAQAQSIAPLSQWMGRTLPTNAVIVQPDEVHNANLLPLGLEGQRFITRIEDTYLLFQPRGRFTPMNLTAYVPLTTERLARMLQDDLPLYALEKDPFRHSRPGVLDPAAFAFTPADKPIAPPPSHALYRAQYTPSNLPNAP